MANDFATYMNTVAARFTELSAHLQPHAAYLSAVYMNPVPEDPMPPNATVKINLVDVAGDVVNAITTAPGTKDVTTTATELSLDDMPTKSFTVSSYESARVADNPALIDMAISKVMIQMIEYLNAKVAAKFVIGTFNTAGNTSSSVTNTNPAKVTFAEFVTLRKVLSARKIPLAERQNLFVIGHSEIYHQWLQDDNFIKVAAISDRKAGELRDSGVIQPQYGFQFLEDPQSVVSGTSPNFTYSTAAFHRNACVFAAAPLEPPAGSVNFRYANVMGIPVLLTFSYDENLGATGGPFNRITVRTLCNVKEHRKDHCVIHRSILTA